MLSKLLQNYCVSCSFSEHRPFTGNRSWSCVCLGSEGRRSVLKSNLLVLKSHLKGHTLHDTIGGAAASPWPLFVALELNVHSPWADGLSQRRHISACAFGDDDFGASSETAT